MDNLYTSGVMRTLKSSEVNVLGCIREHTKGDPKSRAKLTYEDIRLECGIGSDETVASAVARLVDIGVVEKQHTHNQTAGWRAPNIYRVTPGSRRFLAYVEHCRSRAGSFQRLPTKKAPNPSRGSGGVSSSTVLQNL
jgi:hypothetical protein